MVQVHKYYRSSSPVITESKMLRDTIATLEEHNKDDDKKIARELCQFAKILGKHKLRSKKTKNAYYALSLKARDLTPYNVQQYISMK